MKKILLNTLLLSTFLIANENFSRYGHFQKQNQSQRISVAPLASPQILLGDFGIGFDYYHYKEPNVMDIFGPMFNVFGDFSVIKKLFRFQIDASYSTHMDANHYDGSLQSDTGKIPYETKSTDWYANIATKAGFSLYENREILFIYIGLGYRFLWNDIIDKDGIKASYHRYQGYLYLPIGISGEISISPTLSLISLLEYRVLLFGHNTSTFSELGYDRDLFFKQYTGNGARISIGLRYYFSPNYSVKFNFYYDYWSIQDSTLENAYLNGVYKGTFVEPKNHTNVFGINIAFSF